MNMKKHIYNMKKLHWDSRFFAGIYFQFVLVVVLVSWGAYGAGYRINTTPSVARGLWRIHPHVEPQRYDYVAVSPHGNPGLEFGVKRGYITEHTILLKKIVATEGDYVCYDVNERAVTVNGNPILATEILSQDAAGRPLQGADFPVLLKEGQVWLSSEYIRGYDSRYFGPVSLDILTKATPVWVF